MNMFPVRRVPSKAPVQKLSIRLGSVSTRWGKASLDMPCVKSCGINPEQCSLAALKAPSLPAPSRGGEGGRAVSSSGYGDELSGIWDFTATSACHPGLFRDLVQLLGYTEQMLSCNLS